jgi:rubrerythrin
MAAFAEPFVGKIQGSLTKEDLIQALRVDLASELEAMFLYDAHARASEDPFVAAQLRDIRDEEKEHFGELVALLRYLDPVTTDAFLEGQGEVLETAEKMGISLSKLDTV